MDFRGILSAPARAEVEFVVVGGVFAVLQGVPATTFVLDIVPARDEANRRRLPGALEELDARYREHLPKEPRPTLRDLAADGHMLLMTRAGALDVLGTVAGCRTFEELVERSLELDVGAGRPVRLLDLEALVELKERTGGEKDLAQLPLLRRALAERRER